MAFCELTMRSTVLKMDVKVSVIIPESRKDYHLDDSNKKYPCLYVLHGASEDNSSWLNMSNLYLLARDLDLFVVMPSAYNTFYVNTEFGLNMLEYISEELPAKMERLFPISNRREDRFIMGESMGGYGAYINSFTHPEKYSKAVILSGTGYTPNPSPTGLVTGAGCLEFLAKQANDTAEQCTEYYCMCGSEDFRVEERKKFEQYIKDNCSNIKITTEYWSGKHDFFFWNQTTAKALQFLGFQLDPEKIKQI